MKKALSLLLALVLCLSLCACSGNKDAEYVKHLENRIVELEAMLAERDSMLTELEAILTERDETINRLLAEKENTETEITEPENTEPLYETVEITLDNWREYFELRVIREIDLNGFGELQKILTRGFLVNKEGIIPDCHNSDVTFEYTCTYEVRPYTVDIKNKTFAYGEATESYTTKPVVCTLCASDIYVPNGNIIESGSGEVTFIYESGVGEHVEMYAGRIQEIPHDKAEGTMSVIVDIEVSRVIGCLRFSRQDG